MVGREISAVFPKRPVKQGAVALEFNGLTVRQGEILGVAGLVGSGRTELAEAIFGLGPAAVKINVQGKEVNITKPSDAIAAGIAYLPEDRRRHGVVLDMPITANTSLATLPPFLINTNTEEQLAANYVAQLGVKTSSIHAEAGSLSGGNQQKVALSRWLATNPKILILDEPTQGVDIGAKSEIHKLMVDLAEQGLAIVMISSELPEILGMSDRIAVMHSGQITGILARQEATQEKIMSLALEKPC